jgi:hypothetical protein
MGRSLSEGMSSLERLKALGSLPNLSTQLDEAKKLCNHAARAEMVLKWLLDMLKKSPAARELSAAWGLLASTFRLIPPERLANLLGSFDILGVIVGSFNESTNTHDNWMLFESISSTLQILLDLGSGPKGAPLQAYLSVEASAAGTFASAWMRQFLLLTGDECSREYTFSHHSVLELAIRVWDLRKPAGDENQVFATQCLLPVSQLVVLLGQSAQSSQSRKRKIGGTDEVVTLKRCLESLIAKHVFLPARTAFFAKENQQASRKHTLPSDEPALADRLSALNNVEQEQKTLEVRPTLLDIALRCSPSLNPRQRFREIPWVEQIFTALLDTCETLDTVESHEMMRSMLRALREHQPLLSTRYLTEFAKAHLKYGEPPHSHVDWKLMSELVKLDSKVYGDSEMAAALFEDISDAKASMPRDHPSIREDIVVPIMESFAQNRNLGGFVELWHQNLLRVPPESTASIWFELGPAFGSLVENSLTHTQILDTIRNHSQTLFAEPVNGKVEALGDTISKVRASCVVLGGIFHGIRRPAILESTWNAVDELFRILFAVHEDGLFPRPAISSKCAVSRVLTEALGSCAQLWEMLRLALTVWIHRWLETESPNRIADWTSVALQSPFITQADVCAHGKVQLPTTASAFEAEEWLIAFSSELFCHPDAQGTVTELFDSVAEKLPAGRSQLLLRRKKALDRLETQRNDLVMDWVYGTPDEKDPGNANLDRNLVIRAYIATALRNSQPDVMEEAVRQAHNNYETDFDSDGEARTPLVMRVLAQFPPRTLSVPQRKQILDDILDWNHSQELDEVRWRDRLDLPGRLLLLAGVLELPCPNAKLFTDTTALWSLGELYCPGSRIGLKWSTASPEVEQLLEICVRLVMKHLLAVQMQDQPREMIKTFCGETWQHAKELPTKVGERFDGVPGVQIVLNGILRSLTALRPELAAECIDRTALGEFAQKLVTKAQKLSDSEHFAQDSSTQKGFVMLMDALFAIPPEFLADDAGFYTEMREIALGFMLSGGFTSLLDGSKSDGSEVTTFDTVKLVCARSFRASCFGGFPADQPMLTKTAELAVTILAAALQPEEYSSVLDIFDTALTSTSSQVKMQLLQHFLTNATSIHGLDLLDRIVSSLNQEDFGSESPHAVLEQVLRITRKEQSFQATRAACKCIATILRRKHFMTNQFTIEATVATLKSLVQHSKNMSSLYLDYCKVFVNLLQQHRSRLKDRLHLVVDLLQTLLSRLFRKTKKSSANGARLGPRHAGALARLLQLLCGAPPMRSRSKNSDLVDEARKAQAHVGQYMQYVLHHYCVQVLSGTLVEGVREALSPGLDAMIEAMEIGDVDAVKSLSAAMNNSERAVLRGLYEDYKMRRGRRSG